MIKRWQPSQYDFPAAIAKGHGRNYACYLFYNFLVPSNFAPDVKEKRKKYIKHQFEWLAGLSPYLTSYGEQNLQTQVKTAGASGAWPVVNCGLSKDGILKLGLYDIYGEVFESKYRQKFPDTWPAKIFNRIMYPGVSSDDFTGVDGYIMIAADDPAVIRRLIELIEQIRYQDYVKFKKIKSWCRRNEDAGIQDDQKDPLGFIEGISNPRGEAAFEITKRCDPLFSTPGKKVYGSTASIAKIRINYSDFEANVSTQARSLYEKNIPDIESESIEGHPYYESLKEEIRSIYLGRYGNGQPRLRKFTGRHKESYPGPWHHENDWKFDDKDPLNSEEIAFCPHFAHIRATNPRKNNSSVCIVRRGMNYLSKNSTFNTVEKTETEGLLFVAFHRDFDAIEEVVIRMEMAKDPISYHVRDAQLVDTVFVTELMVGGEQEIKLAVVEEALSPTVDMRFQVAGPKGGTWYGEYYPPHDTHLDLIAKEFFYMPPLRFFKYAESMAAAKKQ